jgi:HSP20 family protein
MATDLIETEKEFQVHCDLPGVQNEDVDISVNDGFLVLKAERKAIGD